MAITDKTIEKATAIVIGEMRPGANIENNIIDAQNLASVIVNRKNAGAYGYKTTDTIAAVIDKPKQWSSIGSKSYKNAKNHKNYDQIKEVVQGIITGTNITTLPPNVVMADNLSLKGGKAQKQYDANPNTKVHATTGTGKNKISFIADTRLTSPSIKETPLETPIERYRRESGFRPSGRLTTPEIRDRNIDALREREFDKQLAQATSELGYGLADETERFDPKDLQELSLADIDPNFEFETGGFEPNVQQAKQLAENAARPTGRLTTPEIQERNLAALNQREDLVRGTENIFADTPQNIPFRSVPSIEEAWSREPPSDRIKSGRLTTPEIRDRNIAALNQREDLVRGTENIFADTPQNIPFRSVPSIGEAWSREPPSDRIKSGSLTSQDIQERQLNALREREFQNQLARATSELGIGLADETGGLGPRYDTEEAAELLGNRWGEPKYSSNIGRTSKERAESFEFDKQLAEAAKELGIGLADETGGLGPRYDTERKSKERVFKYLQPSVEGKMNRTLVPKVEQEIPSSKVQPPAWTLEGTRPPDFVSKKGITSEISRDRYEEDKKQDFWDSVMGGKSRPTLSYTQQSPEGARVFEGKGKTAMSLGLPSLINVPLSFIGNAVYDAISDIPVSDRRKGEVGTIGISRGDLFGMPIASVTGTTDRDIDSILAEDAIRAGYDPQSVISNPYGSPQDWDKLAVGPVGDTISGITPTGMVVTPTDTGAREELFTPDDYKDFYGVDSSAIDMDIYNEAIEAGKSHQQAVTEAVGGIGIGLDAYMSPGERLEGSGLLQGGSDPNYLGLNQAASTITSPSPEAVAESLRGTGREFDPEGWADPEAISGVAYNNLTEALAAMDRMAESGDWSVPTEIGSVTSIGDDDQSYEELDAEEDYSSYFGQGGSVPFNKGGLTSLDKPLKYGSGGFLKQALPILALAAFPMLLGGTAASGGLLASLGLGGTGAAAAAPGVAATGAAAAKTAGGGMGLKGLATIAGLLSGAMGSSKSGSGGGNYEEKPSKPFRRLPALNRQRLSGPTSGSSYTHGPENIYFNPVAQDFSHAMFQKDDDYWKANRGGSVPTFNPRKGLPEGGYVLTASDISNSFGNGSTDAGANYVWNNIADKNDPYAGIVKGKGDGMSDSIQTFINPSPTGNNYNYGGGLAQVYNKGNIEDPHGKQVAEVSRDEMILGPRSVAKLGGPANVNKMIDTVRMQKNGGNPNQPNQINMASLPFNLNTMMRRKPS